MATRAASASVAACDATEGIEILPLPVPEAPKNDALNNNEKNDRKRGPVRNDRARSSIRG